MTKSENVTSSNAQKMKLKISLITYFVQCHYTLSNMISFENEAYRPVKKEKQSNLCLIKSDYYLIHSLADVLCISRVIDDSVLIFPKI